MQNEPQPSIFTKIINREIPADIIHEDDMVLAFLDVQPVHYGHTLVVPKKPFVNIFDGDPAVLGHMIAIAQKISQALLTAKLADGVNVTMNNGEAAGQEVFHAHLHVIPRITNDHSFTKPTHTSYTAETAKATAEKIRQTLSST